MCIKNDGEKKLRAAGVLWMESSFKWPFTQDRSGSIISLWKSKADCFFPQIPQKTSEKKHLILKIKNGIAVFYKTSVLYFPWLKKAKFV